MNALVPQQVFANLKSSLSARRAELAPLLPKGVPFSLWLQRCLFAVNRNPDLLKCTPESLQLAMRESLALSLPIGGAIEKSYILPYNNKKKGKKEAKLVLSYKGLIELVRRSGELASVRCQSVREGDQFEIIDGTEQELRHKPSLDAERDSRQITHVYVVFRMKDGSRVYDVWSAQAINKHKERYVPGWTNPDSPWNTSWEAMAFKTVIRSMITRGMLPVDDSIDIGELVENDPEMVGDVVDSAVVMDEPAEDDHEVANRLPDADPGEVGMTFEEMVEIDLMEAKSLADVTVIRECHTSRAASNDQLDFLKQACDAKEEQIRHGRSKATQSHA